MPRLPCSVYLVALLLGGCAGLGQSPQPLHLTILHTNDHHGHFWQNADHEYGMAARKTIIDQVRAEVKAAGGVSLLLDAGDINTGIPESDLQGAEPDFKGMSLLGYDSMTVGNHEFDKTLPLLRRQQNEWSTFPWLSANVYQDGKRMFEPYRIFKLGSLRIAVLGLTTDDAENLIDRDKFPGVVFRPPIDEARVLVPELRKQADMVIASTHMGHYTDGKHGVNAPGDVALARAVPGIDLIVGGHSQNPVCMLAENVRNDAYVPGADCQPDRQNGALIVQAADWGKYVGRADFEYRDGKWTLLHYALIPVNLKGTPEIEENPAALALLAPYQKAGQASTGKVIGHSNGKFDGERANVRGRPTNLGRLVTTAMMERTRSDLAILSGGGLRDSLPVGVLTYRDLLKVQPFGSQLATVSMNGIELMAYLKAVAKMTPGSGAFPQTSGLRMLIRNGELVTALVGDAPVAPGKTYRLVTSDFIAKGGDGYPVLTGSAGLVNTGLVDVEVLAEFITRQGDLLVEKFAPGDNVVRE